MSEEEKQALTGLCKIEIKRWKAASESNPNMRYMSKLMEIALAALTAQPDDWKQRAEAAEAKLAESENQEPAAFTSEHYWSELNTFGAVKCVLLKNGNDPDFQVELFTRPAPAADLADLVPDKLTADGVISMHDCGVVEGWNDCCDAILRKVEGAKW